MICAPRKLRQRRKLSIVPAVIFLVVTVLVWPLSRPLFAQSVAEPAIQLPPAPPNQADVKETLDKTGIKINIDYTESPASAAERLAKALTSATTFDQIQPTAYEALARSGITIKSSTEVFAKTGPRVVKRWLLPSQADNLALDFLEHQGWTLSEMTRAAAEYPNGPGPDLLKRPETLAMLLREWATVAGQSPTDPEAFTPLLLARVAQIRGGGSDFTQGKINPEQVELSYLELMILTAGTFKGLPQSQDSKQFSHAVSVLDCVTSWSAAFLVRPAYADGGDPCSWFKNNIGKGGDAEAAQDFAEEGVGWMMDKALDKTADWLKTVGDGALAKSLSKTVSVFKLTNLLTSMISMYGGHSLTLTWEPTKPHYLGNEHGNASMKIIANVSTRPLADDATLACLKFFGIEKPTSDSMKDTTVEWVSLYGTPKHAQPKFPPSSRENVGTDGQAVLELTMSQEALGEETKKSGKLKRDQVVMQANLIVYKSNPGKIMAAALFGGVAGGNIEILKGWFSNWFPKRAVARVPVEWHKLSRWRCVAESPESPVRIVYTSGLGTKSIWTWSIEGDRRFSGKGTLDLTSGSTRYTITTKITDGDVTATGTTPETASLGGTDEEPTLILGVDGKLHSVASDKSGGKGSVTHNAKGQRTFKLEEIE